MYNPRLSIAEFANWICESILSMTGVEQDGRAAGNPSPALNVEWNDYPGLPVLVWDAGARAVEHDVYVGTGYRHVKDADRQSANVFKGRQRQTVYPLGEADPAQKYYYWRIDEVDASGVVTKGQVWWFAYVPYRVRNLSVGQGYVYIQDAIDASNSGDTIEVYPGTYREGVYLRPDRSVTLRGTNPEDWTVVAGTVIDLLNTGQTVRMVGDSMIEGLTIQNGSYYGIQCTGPNSQPVLRRCLVQGNDFGIFSYNGSSPVIQNCRIMRNARMGIYIERSGLSQTVISGNWICGSPDSCAVYITDSATAAEIENNTIVGNAWGIYAYDSACPNVRNCIFWSNGDDLHGCGATYSCVREGVTGVGNISSDPRFVDPANDDYHLLGDSPCIDAGDPSVDYAAQLDIDGQDRVMDGDIDSVVRVDMGADEFRWEPPILPNALSDALDARLSIGTGGDADWFRQGTVSYYRSDAAQSGDIGDSQQSWMETTVDGPGRLSFWWKVSSESNWDWLRFSVDGLQQDQISGEVDWQQKTYEIATTGSYVLRWSYTKDVSVDAGSDCGWVESW
jgi:parallel beta-helix repeat protein